MSKILFLGHEGSGKTVLMGILSCYFETAGDGKWSLNPKNQDAFTFMEFVPAALAAGKWPAQTTLDGIRRFEWDIEYDGKTYSKIEMVDYPGEAFRALFDQSKLTDILNNLRPDCTILSELIRSAENIFLVINPSDILRNEGGVKRTETIWQLCEAVDYLKTLPKKPKFTLVLTQMDRYCDSVETLNAKQILLNANALFVKRGFESLDIIGISAIGKTVKNRYGDDIPDMKNSHPINLSDLILRILVDSPVTLEIRNLHELITSATQNLNRHCLTLDHCTSLTTTLNRLIVQIHQSYKKYGYLLGEKLHSECASILAQCKDAIIHLNQRAKDIRIQAELERKRKEAEALIDTLKTDIANIIVLLVDASIASLQTSSEVNERISKLETLKSSIKTTRLNHPIVIGESLVKQCDYNLKKCDTTIAQLKKKAKQLFAEEDLSRKQKEEETKRKLQIKIEQATKQLKAQLKIINAKDNLTYETLCKWFAAIRSSCQFLVQHTSTQTAAHDLIKISNLLCQYEKDPSNTRSFTKSLLLQFETKYPFVTKAKLAIDQKRQYAIREKRQQAIREAGKNSLFVAIFSFFIFFLFLYFSDSHGFSLLKFAICIILSGIVAIVSFFGFLSSSIQA
ncbi:MAG: hypothetical protein IKW38_01445 [Kiritimatiellae bacterium]|nr:hypothetical protein [Kiritimatiellia bacterium]